MEKRKTVGAGEGIITQNEAKNMRTHLLTSLQIVIPVLGGGISSCSGGSIKLCYSSNSRPLGLVTGTCWKAASYQGWVGAQRPDHLPETNFILYHRDDSRAGASDSLSVYI